MGADHLRDVSDQLPLRFVLIQRAVAAVHAEARPEVEAAVPFDEAAKQARRKPAVEIQPGNAGVLRRRGLETNIVSRTTQTTEAYKVSDARVNTPAGRDRARRGGRPRA